jgi:hypothetical protein
MKKQPKAMDILVGNNMSNLLIIGGNYGLFVILKDFIASTTFFQR